MPAFWGNLGKMLSSLLTVARGCGMLWVVADMAGMVECRRPSNRG